MAGKSRFWFTVFYNWQGKDCSLSSHCLAWHKEEAEEYARRQVPAGSVISSVEVTA